MSYSFRASRPLPPNATPYTSTIHTTDATHVPGCSPHVIDSTISNSASPPIYTTQGIIAPGEARHANTINGQASLELGSDGVLREVSRGMYETRNVVVEWGEPFGAQAVWRPLVDDDGERRGMEFSAGEVVQDRSEPPAYESEEVGMVMRRYSIATMTRRSRMATTTTRHVDERVETAGGGRSHRSCVRSQSHHPTETCS